MAVFFLVFVCAGCACFRGETPRDHERTISFDPAVSRQIIEITPSSTHIFKATLIGWSYDRGLWRRVYGPWPVVIGRNGLALLHEKREGDGKTPSGVYPLETAFGQEKGLRTGLIYRQVTDDDVWVDDMASVDYNRWVKKPTQAASYESMRRTDGVYELGAVIEYNTRPVVPWLGSAIFIHIWRYRGRKPTAGCVALDRRRLRHLLAWLRADMHPTIMLGTPPKDH